MPANSVIASHEAFFWFGLFVLDRGLAEVFPARIARGVIHTAVGIVAVLYGVGWLSDVSVSAWIPTIPTIPTIPNGKQILQVVFFLFLGLGILFTLREFRESIRTTDEVNGGILKSAVRDVVVGITIFMAMWIGFLVAAYLRSTR